MLVFRRYQDKVDVRYYDSLSELAVYNLSKAETIVKVVRDELQLEELPTIERSNTRSRQTNGVDCGVFALHFWEGEVRRFRGEGWAMEFPQTSGNIKVRKNRLRQLVGQVQKAVEKAVEPDDGGPKAKKKNKVGSFESAGPFI